jgi:3-deoxy-D-manno-octulosonic-acid transferase
LTQRSRSEPPGGAVHLADTFGELGLWYRVAPVTLMGGSFGPVQGHNPWEPAALGSAILHGPNVANFAADYGELNAARAALMVDPDTLVTAVRSDLSGMAAKARAMSYDAQGSLAPLARDLLSLMAAG